MHAAASMVAGAASPLSGHSSSAPSPLPGCGKRRHSDCLRLQAPELLGGAPASVASDTYSLGLVMWELLCWQLPFQEAREAGATFFKARRSAPLLPRRCTAAPSSRKRCLL